ncbi:Rhamnogalacturonate lyase-like protein [Drosera capensis]
MDNGILQVTFSKPGGFVTGIQFGGIDNALEIHNDETNRGYWDIVSGFGEYDFDGYRERGRYNECAGDLSDEVPIVGSNFEIVKADENETEISFATSWDSARGSQNFPFNVDRRFIMLRGSSGFYGYGIFERKEGWPAASIGQLRAVFKPRNDKFNYMALSDKIQRVMPTPVDREKGQTLAYPEAVRLTNPADPALKGEVDDKYQYSYEDINTKLHGWVSSDPPVGFWLITPSNDYRTAGPVKQDLTSHVGPTSLVMLHSTHYVGKDLKLAFQNGEPWKKVFGPFFVYLNAVPPQKDPHQPLWQNAKEQLSEEIGKWPYDFPLSQDFAKSNQRGSVEGRLLIQDGKTYPPASSAWVGLCPPGKAGSWQLETKGYQFWVQTDKGGSFVIREIFPGTYNLYAWAPGFIGDYKYASNINITAGSDIKLGDLVYAPPRNGPTLWEIGVPDRSAAEYFVPDPSPDLVNRLYVHDPEDKYRQYGLWDRYTDLYPTSDLVYTVGSSDYKKEWFFAHLNRRTQNQSYVATTWQIVFPLDTVSTGNYTLWLALAAAHEAELQVRFNSHKLSATPHFTTGFIGRDNAIARHGIHGLYRQFCVTVDSSWLRKGTNTIFLTQARSGSPFRGLMYDYIRLEGPLS